MWHMRVFKQLVQLGVFSALCLCACGACVCVSIAFLMLFRQLPYLKFHNKIFATNWSQIWVFFEDLIKYILSLENCNTICKKGNKNYKKKKCVWPFLGNYALKSWQFHCVKSVPVQSFFRSVFSCIRTEYRKIRTRKKLYLDTFHAVFQIFFFNSRL